MRDRITYGEVLDAIHIQQQGDGLYRLDLNGYVYRRNIELYSQAEIARNLIADSLWEWLDKVGLRLFPEDIPPCDNCDDRSARYHVEFWCDDGQSTGKCAGDYCEEHYLEVKEMYGVYQVREYRTRDDSGEMTHG
jgi:hypothetical protein